MRDEQVHVLAAQAQLLEHLDAGVGHLAHGVLEDVLAFLVDVVQVLLDGLVAGGAQAAAGRHAQETAARAVDLVGEAQQAGLVVGGLQQHGPGPVPEQHAGGAVLVVQDRGHDLGPDHQHALVGPALDELGPGGEGVDEAGAGRLQVEAPGPVGAQLVLHEAGRGGEGHVGGNGGDDDQLDLAGADAAALEALAGRPHGQVAGAGAGRGHVPLADAGAGADPLVRGVDDLLEVRIGHHPLGDVPSQRGDARAHS